MLAGSPTFAHRFALTRLAPTVVILIGIVGCAEFMSGGTVDPLVDARNPGPLSDPLLRLPPIGPPGSQADLVANVGDRVYFDYDQSDLRARRA